MYIDLLSKMTIILGDHIFRDNCKVEKSVPQWLITNGNVCKIKGVLPARLQNSNVTSQKTLK
jgi:hypothetical protein